MTLGLLCALIAITFASCHHVFQVYFPNNIPEELRLSQETENDVYARCMLPELTREEHPASKLLSTESQNVPSTYDTFNLGIILQSSRSPQFRVAGWMETIWKLLSFDVGLM